MTIEEKADLEISKHGKDKAIIELKNQIFLMENSFEKNGYTSEDLRKVKEMREIVKEIQSRQ